MTNPAVHVPVMADRILELLAPALQTSASQTSAPVVIDATLGLGGHTEAMLRAFDNIRVIGIDRDREALRRSASRLAVFGDRVSFVNAVYDEIPQILSEAGIEQIDAALFDLGVSSMQLDLAERGFAYSQDAPLDMRMNTDDPLTAASVVNTYSARDLARVFRDYGEERFASRVAKAIVAEREREPFNSTARLAELVRSAIPAATRRTGGHPAKRVFQALRIEVNRELDALREAIPAATSALKVGGRVIVLSYQSLEDRIVKRHFVSLASDTTPLGLPVALKDAGPELRLVVRGDAPTEAEIQQNPRAASARLRVVERLRPAPSSQAKGQRR